MTNKSGRHDTVTEHGQPFTVEGMAVLEQHLAAALHEDGVVDGTCPVCIDIVRRSAVVPRWDGFPLYIREAKNIRRSDGWMPGDIHPK